MELGPLKLELNAEREVLDDVRIRVTFRETVVFLFGVEVVRKETKGKGVWKYMFSGVVDVDQPSAQGGGGADGGRKQMLVRVMKTPSTFVIVQDQ